MMAGTHGTGSDADRRARGAEWEDLPLERIAELTERSRRVGWRAALAEVEGERPFFARRMRNLPLGNWHLLRALPRQSRALDLGCGFGSLALGLAKHFDSVVGVDPLWSRIAYASLRAREDGAAASFVRGSGFALPFRPGTFELVTMNGVLEWAGLFADGAPRRLQLGVLREARRLLAPGGTLAVAIENRFAMETLAGMPDTHTGLRLAPALPRHVAALLSRAIRRRPFRTYLYDAAGYRRLLREAGFPSVRVYDLVSSYNDYDFIVEPSDADTYRLLWDGGLVRTFYSRAGRVRRLIASRWPGALGGLGYAFLLLGAANGETLLDADHDAWTRAAAAGVGAGRSRFACQGSRVGSLLLVSHDAGRVVGAVEVGIEPRDDATATSASGSAPTGFAGDGFGLSWTLAGGWSEGGIAFRAWRPERRDR
jgi:SAM-dependent methyltransferase